ncbi:MAG TPA: hypothetical protein VGP43_02570 [Chitinophagaceae bacterium]|nr:hypothetical protein [Chitinophagaceae bacterium]
MKLKLPTIDLTFTAATLKATHKLSYADALALHINGTLVINDKEFANRKDIKGCKFKYVS